MVFVIAGATSCIARGKLGGVGACSPMEILILDLLLDTIWWNLGLFTSVKCKLLL